LLNIENEFEDIENILRLWKLEFVYFLLES